MKAKKPNGVEPIILSGHTDVVPVSKGWATDPFDATIKEDKLFGRGSCDMKGFIACALAYAPIFSSSNLDRDIHFSFTFDEETACKGAPILITELKKRGIKDCICIVGEPTNMKIIDAHHHLWDINLHDYPWLKKDSKSPLSKNYLIEDFNQDIEGLEVVKSVHVQGEMNHENSIDETLSLIHI